MRARSRYFHWRWPDDAYPSHSAMFKVFCCPSTTMKHTSICVKRRDAVAHRGAGVVQAWLRLRNSCRSSEATHGQASVCAERHCTANLQSLSSGPHSAVSAQITLALDARMCFIPAGSASVLLPPRLCTCYLALDLQCMSHFNARWRLCSLTTSALVAPCTVRSTIGDCTFPATAASVWNSLPEPVRSSSSLQVFRSRLKTELFACSYNYD